MGFQEIFNAEGGNSVRSKLNNMFLELFNQITAPIVRLIQDTNGDTIVGTEATTNADYVYAQVPHSTGADALRVINGTGNTVAKIDDVGKIYGDALTGINSLNIKINSYYDAQELTGAHNTFIGTSRARGNASNSIIIGGEYTNETNVSRNFSLSDAILIYPNFNEKWNKPKRIIFGNYTSQIDATYAFYADLVQNSGQSVTLPALSNVVTGTGTTFLTTFKIGQKIVIGGNLIYTVVAINTDTELLVSPRNPSTSAEVGVIKTSREFPFSVLDARGNGLVVGSNKYGNLVCATKTLFGRNTNPTEVVDINGNLRLTGVQKNIGLTQTEIDALTPSPGWEVYNTTTNKKQCFDGTIWNNLY